MLPEHRRYGGLNHAELTDCTGMAPTNKAQAAGVSAGSFLELRAQVAKQKESLIKGKATAVAGRKKEGKVRSNSPLELLHFSRDNLLALSQKPTKWAFTNKGVEGRAARDLEQDRLDRRTVESTRSILERKTKLYEKLKKGQSGGLSEAQFDSLLVDVRSPRPFRCGTSCDRSCSSSLNRTILTSPIATMLTNH